MRCTAPAAKHHRGRRALLVACVLASGFASACTAAAAADLTRRRPPPVARVPVRAVLVPNCWEADPPRILGCRPQVAASDSPAVEAALQAPPARLRRPYPALFSWPYGANER